MDNVERKTTMDTAPQFELDTSDLTGFNLSLESESVENEVETNEPSVTEDPKQEETSSEEEQEQTIDDHVVPVLSGEVVNLGFDSPKESEEIESEPETNSSQEETTNQPAIEADSLATGIYQTMVDRGYIAPSDDFKGTMEEVDELFSALPTAVFNATFQQYPEPFQQLLAFGWEKGESVTPEDLSEFFNKYVKETVNEQEIDISTQTAAMDFVVRELVATGDYDQEDAIILAERWQDRDVLMSKAEKFKQRKIDEPKQAAAAEIEAVRLANQAQREKDLAKAKSIKKAIEESSWSNQRKQTVFNELFTDSFKDKSRKVSEHPKALTQLANYLSFFNEETGEIDETAYKKQAFSKEAKQIKSKIQKNFENVSFAKSSTVQKPKKSTDEEWEFA